MAAQEQALFGRTQFITACCIAALIVFVRDPAGLHRLTVSDE